MSEHGPIVWIAGTNWDGVAGTDKRIVESLARFRPVLWVDPPARATRKTARHLWARLDPMDNPAGLERVAESILRLKVTVLPGVTRPGVRRLTALLLDRAITSALSWTGWEPEAVVVAMPLTRFPRRTPGTGGPLRSTVFGVATPAGRSTSRHISGPAASTRPSGTN